MAAWGLLTASRHPVLSGLPTPPPPQGLPPPLSPLGLLPPHSPRASRCPDAPEVIPPPRPLIASHHSVPSWLPASVSPQGLLSPCHLRTSPAPQPFMACRHPVPSGPPAALVHLKALHRPGPSRSFTSPSSQGLPPPCPLRVSPSPENLPHSRTALKKLHRRRLKRHLGPLNNPASNTRAGNNWQFRAGRIFVGISKDKFFRRSAHELCWKR